MKTKLILSIDKEIIARAKARCKEQKISLSKLVEMSY